MYDTHHTHALAFRSTAAARAMKAFKYFFFEVLKVAYNKSIYIYIKKNEFSIKAEYLISPEHRAISDAVIEHNEMYGDNTPAEFCAAHGLHSPAPPCNTYGECTGARRADTCSVSLIIIFFHSLLVTVIFIPFRENRSRGLQFS